ncbi:MAG: hypothetical protein ACRDPV_15950 [Gaiellaceae bacterium]
MPTRDIADSFRQDWGRLTPEQQRAFRIAVAKFIGDLRARRAFRSSLRVKGVRTEQGVLEMTWAPDGRATFSYGQSVVEGEPHIIWRRIGTHEILREP